MGCTLLVLAAPSAAAQAADPKTEFVEALARFGLSLDGPFGDEGTAVLSSLDAMVIGLLRWDLTIRRSEADMATGLTNADAGLAAAMHMAIGGAYLDRSRVDDALREFDTASRLDASRGDLFTFQGLIYSQIAHDPARAIEAFGKASALDPRNPARAWRPTCAAMPKANRKRSASLSV